MRIGIGYDVHKFSKNTSLVLGGCNIDFEFGLAGYSDADVVIHSIIDAILGAAGQGDIGEHFPPGNEEFLGISSVVLLGKVAELIEEKGFFIVNIDTTIIAEKPKLVKYKEKMQNNISKALKINSEKVNIKATTTEKLGFVGRGEGIACQSVTLIDLLE
ncbi:MAG: 2-C-methyl-D-erythritol 2,4-cyclodiphosphate synthase [Halarsenatibacteraceae bacterium]